MTQEQGLPPSANHFFYFYAVKYADQRKCWDFCF